MEDPVKFRHRSVRAPGAFIRLTWFLGTLTPSLATASTLPWLDYHVVNGCPPRDEFERELLERANGQPLTAPERLRVEVTFNGTDYEGYVRLRSGKTTAERIVRDGSCNQLTQAMTFIAALMLEAERSTHLEPPLSNPASEPVIDAPLEAPQDRRTADVPAILPTHHLEPKPQPRKAPTSNLAFGPWFSLTLERSALPNTEFGPRLGAFVETRGIRSGTSEALRISLTQLSSGTLRFDDRTANIEWTAVRIDFCHTFTVAESTTLGLCALAEAGTLKGQGRVNEVTISENATWGAIGAMLDVRQHLFGPLTLGIDGGLVRPLTKPEFYFAETATTPETRIFRPRSLGQAADVVLELRF